MRRFSGLPTCALFVVSLLFGAAPVTARAASVDEATARSGFSTLLKSFSKAQQRALDTVSQTACSLRKGPLKGVQSVGFHLTAPLGMLFPPLGLVGLDVSVSSGFSLSHTPGRDYVEIQGDAIPGAGIGFEILKFAETPPWRIPGEPSVAFTSGCDFTEADPSPFAVGQFFGGIGIGLKYGVNLDALYFGLTRDQTDKPKTVRDFRVAARAAAEGFGNALARLRRPGESALRREAFPIDIPAFPKTSDENASHSLADLFETITEIARDHIDPARTSPIAVAESVMKQLSHLKRGEDVTVAAKRAEEVQQTYQTLGATSQRLVRAVFPVTMNPESHAFFLKVTESEPREAGWLGGLEFSGVKGHRAGPGEKHVVPVDRQKATVLRNAARAVTREKALRTAWCDGKSRFVAVKIETREAGKVRKTKHYVDCATEKTYPATAADGEGETFSSYAGWIRAHREIFVHAEALRWALNGYTHVVNNAYARWTMGQILNPDEIEIGGVRPGRPIFNGCNTVFMLLSDGGMNAASRLGTALTAAAMVVKSYPDTLRGVGNAFRAAGAMWEGRTLSYGLNLSTYYTVGPSFRVPLEQLPSPMRALVSGHCAN